MDEVEKAHPHLRKFFLGLMDRGTVTDNHGRTLFFSTQFTNCNLCHDLRGGDGRLETSTFSSHKYFNIGVPRNPDVRKAYLG